MWVRWGSGRLPRPRSISSICGLTFILMGILGRFVMLIALSLKWTLSFEPLLCSCVYCILSPPGVMEILINIGTTTLAWVYEESCTQNAEL